MSRRLFTALLILAMCVPLLGPASRVEAVTTETTLVYDFIANAPSAVWRSLTTVLPFGGPNTDARGFAMYVAPATMEDGTTQAKVLETHPRWIDGGWIEGLYSNISVPSGATLNVKVGFLKGATASNGVRYLVLFQETGTTTFYYFPDGTTATNEGRLKAYDGTMWSYSWDLQELAGKTGKFYLQVFAAGSSTQDWACWQRADITALSVPGSVEAHGVGPDVTVSWEYSYPDAVLFTSLKFEVQKKSLLFWSNVGTVNYPTKSLTIEGLTPGEHRFRVRAVETFTLFRPWPLDPITSTTRSDYSGEVSAWVLATPTGTAVQHVPNTADVRVVWTGLDALAAGYEVLRTTNPLMRPSVVREGPRTETNWVNTGLDPNTSYYFYVRAWKAGTESADRDVSAMSPMLTILTVPAQPTAETATSSGRTITISWTHSGACEKFHIWSKPTRVTDPVMPDMLPSTQRSKVIADAEYGKWTVQIRAWNNGGYSPEEPPLDVWVLTAPSAPLAAVAGTTTVNLTWGAPDANAATVRIQRSVTAGPFADLATVASSITSFTDATCLPGTAYAYRLQAVRDDDASELSPASSSVTTPAALTPPATPTGLAAVAQSATAVGLTWTDTANNEDSYRVYRRDGAVVTFTQASPDLPAGTTSWQDVGVAPSSLYTYAVKARNAAGDSGWSNEASVTTPAAPIVPPSAPTALNAVAGTPRSVEINWIDNASSEDGFRIERRTGSGAWMLVKTLGTDAIKWLDETVVPSTSYSYRVRTYNAGGESGWSNETTVMTPAEMKTTVIKLIIGDKAYSVNGVPMMMDVAPVIMESRTLGPVRYIAEALGASVAWDAVERKATITMGSKVLELWIGKNSARVNGAYLFIDPLNPEVKPIILPPGRTMLPFRFIAEQLGAVVEWDAVKREVTITYKA